jgi:rhodanese-related sulfurtransferase
MNGIRQISAEDAFAAQASGTAVIVDVREDDEIAQAAIPDALPLPLSRFHPDDLPELNGRDLILSCLSGGRSQRAAQALAGAGIEAANLIGGITAWAGAGLPVTRA